MLYMTRASVLTSTRKLHYSFLASYASLRNLSTAAERLGFVNPSYGTPVDSSSDELFGGFQQDSYAHSLNPCYGHGFYQNCSNGYNDQSVRLRESWQSSDGGFIYSHQPSWNAQSQSWDSYNGGHSQTWRISHDQGMNHFEQEGSGNGSLEILDKICREGKVKDAIEIIKSWRHEGYVVDLPRLLWLVQLCGDAQALEEAKVVHEFIRSSVSLSVYNSIIEMYTDCESVEDALIVLNGMDERNLETWCAIIRCMANNGQAEETIDMFSRFKEEGNIPNGEVFKVIFFACGVLGDIDEGLLHFESMIKDYGIVPFMEHYVSLVKMLAEPGYLDEALKFVEPMEPKVDLWETLMNYSRIHGDLELGDRCQDMVAQLDASRLNSESKAGLVPVSLSDIAKEKLRGRNFERECFAAGDTSRPENTEVYNALKSLKEHMIEIGYVPMSKLALHDVDEESKDESLLNHIMKFAFIQAMLDTPARSTIRVMEKFRFCNDCHNPWKMMSKIAGRLLVSRDAERFHHAKDGVCSCKDYW